MFIIFKKIFLIFFLILLCTTRVEAKLTPGVNKFAWKASLEAVKFMPLNSADPFSGIIITDWYSVNAFTRYKLNIYILDGILNARSVQVSVFKQIKENNFWKDTPVSNEVALSLEENILNHAKKLRNSYYE